MVNVSLLKEGNLVRILIDDKRYELKAGDILKVIGTGYSSWDKMYYADCKTEKDYTVEIMYDFMDYELVV